MSTVLLPAILFWCFQKQFQVHFESHDLDWLAEEAILARACHFGD